MIYVWPTEGHDGVQIAPFQVLATDGTTYEARDHLWHLGIADRMVDARAHATRVRRSRHG